MFIFLLHPTKTMHTHMKAALSAKTKSTAQPKSRKKPWHQNNLIISSTVK